MAEQPKGSAPQPGPRRPGGTGGTPTQPAAAATARLREIGGFELLTKIGQGGMATVFKARQKTLDRIVALKILPPSVAKDTEFLERFQREARASAKLNHPNIVLGIDVGQDAATGLWYFAMELVDGPSLKEVLKKQGVIPELHALDIVAQVARALDCIAAHGMIHRDVKPDNILMTPQGEAKLADLGLAKQLADDAAITQSGDTVGTPHYMAPEQVRGQKDLLDIRTDIYALGVTLFHLVTGRTPFQGSTGAVIMSKHLSEPVPSARRVNPEVSEGCARLIERMMQKKPEDRVQTPAELLKLLDKVRKGEVTGLRQPVRGTTGPHAGVKRSRREAVRARGASWPLRLAMVVAALVALGLGVVTLVVPGGVPGLLGAPPPAPKAAQDDKLALARPKADDMPAVSDKSALKKDASAEGAKKPDGEKPSEVTVQPKPDRKAGAPETNELELCGPPLPEGFEPPPPDEAARKVAPDGHAWGGFRGEYYVGESFDTLKSTQQDQTVEFRWLAGAPEGYLPRVGFSARWSGFVEPPASGDYVFDIVSYAGSRLYVGTCLLFDSWGGKGNIGKSVPVPLEKGKKYAIRFEVHNRSAERTAAACLKWGLAGEPAELVNADPPEMVDPMAPVGSLPGGWQAEYGKSGAEEPLVTRRELAIAWDWGPGSPAPEIPPDRFWGRWRGLVVPPDTDDYVFHVASDEGARLFINDMLLADYLNLGAGKADAPPVRLEKGKSYLVRLEYTEGNEYASCVLRWSCKTFPPMLVPAAGVGDPSGVLSQDGFIAEYGHSGSPKPLLTRREVQAGWNWKGGSPAPEINPDRFWATYTGWITPPADAEYTFTLDFDEGVHFYLDDVFLYDSGNRGGDAAVDVGPLSLKGGKHYFVRLEYWEHNEHARLRFLWRAPEMPKRVVAAVIPGAVSAATIARAGGVQTLPNDIGRIEAGVLAEYGTAKVPVIRRLEGRVCHNFHRDTPGPEIGEAPVFWGRWAGGLRITAPGAYAFRLEAEAAAELRLREVPVLKVPGTAPKTPPSRDRKGAEAPRLSSAESPPLPLVKAVYFLELSLTSSRRGSDYPTFITLTWKPPGKTEYEDIPPDVFVLPPAAKQIPRRLPK